MKKQIWVTDTHLGIKQSNEFWSNVVIDLFDDIINKCKEEDIDEIVHLGDFFDTRKSLNVMTLNIASQICEKLKENNINMYIIRGNHDTFYKNQAKPHSLITLGQFENITIIDDEPYQLGNLVLVPYGTNFDNVADDSIVLGHFEIGGFPLNVAGTVHRGDALSISDFKRFKEVYSGHFHTYSQDENITYIGSPYQISFNDMNQRKGFYVYDGSLNFIENTKSPKFKRILASNINNVSPEDIKGNIVELIFDEDFGLKANKKITETIESFEPFELATKYTMKETLTYDDEFDLNMFSNRQIIEHFIDNKEYPANINKKTVISLIENLVGVN
jgi:DNA repair exonuclease SbcCD nuclease subunit